MLGGRRSGQNQALEQTRDSVLRHGEPVGRALLNFVVLPPQSCPKPASVQAFHCLVFSQPCAFAAPERREVLR